MAHLISYDFGTGGIKAALYSVEGECLQDSFESYPTHYPEAGYHEQSQTDWWNAFVLSTRKLLEKSQVDPNSIKGLGISGHSLGAIPLAEDGTLLREQTPIWSDGRATAQADQFFETIDEEEWYMTTGNGFPPAIYTLFKIMWYRDNEAEMFSKIHKVVGSKDYINYKLTGIMATDYSYASGCGAYNLKEWRYEDRYIEAAGLSPEIFPELKASTDILGGLTAEAASELGLPQSVQVVAGGVDNSCMALGAGNIVEGSVYNSLGTSSWVAISSEKPLLSLDSRPYVFTHVLPGMFTSATAIFSAGGSFNWVAKQLCQDLANQEKSIYELMSQEAETSTLGANKLLFNPNLAGGSSLDKTPDIRGAYLGLDLGHTRSDIIRATMEGIALGLKTAVNELAKLTTLTPPMTLVGGASKDSFWCQIFTDAYDIETRKTCIDQQCASLGAAALAAVGIGLWNDFSRIEVRHKVENSYSVNSENAEAYKKIHKVFSKASSQLAELSQDLKEL